MLNQEWLVSNNRNLCIASNKYMSVKVPKLGVIFFHGFSQTKAGAYGLFTQIISSIAHYCYVITFDYGGCGDSEGLSEELDLDSMVSDARQVFDWFKRNSCCDKYIFIGHGSGNMVVSLLANSYKDNIISILIAPHYLPIANEAKYTSIVNKIKNQPMCFDTADLGEWTTDIDDLFSLLGGRLNRARGIVVKKLFLWQLLNFNFLDTCKKNSNIYSFITKGTVHPVLSQIIDEKEMKTSDALCTDMLIREELIKNINEILCEVSEEMGIC